MSQSRRCDIFKANDEKWYMLLGEFEHAWAERNCTYYGPFASQTDAEAHLTQFSNPGGVWLDSSGARKAPDEPESPQRFSCWYAR